MKPEKTPKRSKVLLACIEVLTIIERRLPGTGYADRDDRLRLVRAVMLWCGITKEQL